MLISVDVMDWESIPESFKETIREKYVVVQEEARRPEGWREVRLGEVAEVNPRETITKGAKAHWQAAPLDSIGDYLNGLACQKFPPENETEKLPVLKIPERIGMSEISPGKRN